MENPRIDKKLEAAVNRGLAAALLGDRRTGLKVMVAEGVPPTVALRVFLYPKLRRASDWRH